MRLIKFLPLVLLLVLIPARSFAEMPEISAGQSYFDIFKGYYVLKDNVHVKMNNHGFIATISANEAKVNVVTQKCWAEGKVRFTHGTETFSCDSAFLQWKTRTAEVVGSVKFSSQKNLSVTSETAIFNWGSKVVDFYGNVKIKAMKNLQVDEGLKLFNKTYQHVRYDVISNKVLALDENFDVPRIVIPNPDEDSEED